MNKFNRDKVLTNCNIILDMISRDRHSREQQAVDEFNSRWTVRKGISKPVENYKELLKRSKPMDYQFYFGGLRQEEHKIQKLKDYVEECTAIDRHYVNLTLEQFTLIDRWVKEVNRE